MRLEKKIKKLTKNYFLFCMCSLLLINILCLGLFADEYSQDEQINIGKLEQTCSKLEFSIEAEKGPNPWTKLAFHNDPYDFQFAVIADLTGGERSGVFADAVKKLNLLQPEFVMSIGDLIQGHTPKQEQLEADWVRFKKLVKPLEMSFFCVPGNHDYWYSTAQRRVEEIYDMAAKWKEHNGCSYYHFIYKDVLFLIMNNSMDPNDPDYKAEIEYCKKVLSENKDARWTFAFFHYRIFDYNTQIFPWFLGNTIWKEIEPLMMKRKFTLFCGNEHRYMRWGTDEQDFIQTCVTGGMCRLRGVNYGEFDHIMWVTMKKGGPPIIANLMLDGIYDKNTNSPKSHELAENLYYKPVISTPIVISEKPVFDGREYALTLKNPNNAPVKVYCEIEQHNQLQITPQVIDVTLSPEEKRNINLSLKVKEPMPTLKIAPIILDWHAAHQMEDMQDVKAQGKARIVLQPSGKAPRPSVPTIVHNFDGPTLEKVWIPLGALGTFNGKGQIILSDDPTQPDAPNACYSDAMGQWNYDGYKLWTLPAAGFFRDIPADTFEAQLKLSEINWQGDKKVFRWEFWDNPSYYYRYGPQFKAGLVLRVLEENGKPFISISKVYSYKYEDICKKELEYKPDSITLRANWDESTQTWEFYYGLNGEEPVTEISGSKITETTPVAPEGKRTLVYVEQNDTKEKSGFSVSLDEYTIYHLR